MAKRIGIIGSGNWGSTIAKIVGNNVKKFDQFENEVFMWVFEEDINGEKLSHIINTKHENVKYLPNIRLPENVIANTDIGAVTKASDIFIIVMPHQFLNRTLMGMKDHVKKNARAISLLKGLAVSSGVGLNLLSDSIREALGIPCAVLMGANLATEVAQEAFCEATLAIKDQTVGIELKKLFQTDYFRIKIIEDEVGTELCGALKNIVAVAVGIAQGLGYQENTKAALMRLGLMEMKRFSLHFFGKRNPQESTFFESCGFADLVVTCVGGRNRKIGHALATSTSHWTDLERELLKGQSAQGPITAGEVYEMIEKNNLFSEYPMFVAVHQVCNRLLSPNEFLDRLKNHPEHR